MKRGSPDINMQSPDKKLNLGHGRGGSPLMEASKPVMGRGRGRGLMSFIPKNRVDSAKIKSLLDDDFISRVVNGEPIEVSRATKLSEIRSQSSSGLKNANT